MQAPPQQNIINYYIILTFVKCIYYIPIDKQKNICVYYIGAKMNNSFVFHAHNHRLKINKSTGDSDITFDVDITQTPFLAPFLLIEQNTSLKVTVEIEKDGQ